MKMPITSRTSGVTATAASTSTASSDFSTNNKKGLANARPFLFLRQVDLLIDRISSLLFGVACGLVCVDTLLPLDIVVVEAGLPTRAPAFMSTLALLLEALIN